MPIDQSIKPRLSCPGTTRPDHGRVMAGPAPHDARGPPSEGSEITVTDTSEQTLLAVSPASDGATAQGTSPAEQAPSSDSPSVAPTNDSARPAKRRAGSLSSMLLPELQELASSLGITTTKMKKSELVAAIQQARSGSSAQSATAPAQVSAQPTLVDSPATDEGQGAPSGQRRERRGASRAAGSPSADASASDNADNADAAPART